MPAVCLGNEEAHVFPVLFRIGAVRLIPTVSPAGEGMHAPMPLKVVQTIDLLLRPGHFGRGVMHRF